MTFRQVFTANNNGLTDSRPGTSSLNDPKLTNQVNNQSKIIYGRDTTNFDSEDDYRTGCRNVSHCHQLNPVQVDYL